MSLCKKERERKMGRVIRPDIDLDLHREDIALLRELAGKYHPRGMMLVERMQVSDEKESYLLTIQVPRALVEWAREMSRKYRERGFVLALIRKVLEELDFFEDDPGGSHGSFSRYIH
jgi:hypothetical protein